MRLTRQTMLTMLTRTGVTATRWLSATIWLPRVTIQQRLGRRPWLRTIFRPLVRRAAIDDVHHHQGQSQQSLYPERSDDEEIPSVFLELLRKKESKNMTTHGAYFA
ncbi:hypothetical protein PMIN06_012800 [Paraphaeosphaeria minitans]